ncbi:MAG: precorrin-3B C(17)-methyltransferase [Chloroflexota bacterium]
MLSLISIGPGDLNYMIPAASQALQTADIIIGYQFYLDQVQHMLNDQQRMITSQLGSEMDRAEQAVALSQERQHVAMISSGDIGIYAMASPIFDVLRAQNWAGENPEVQVYPGISAIQAASARLGAPLGHDFCTISLSDLLTPWPVIQKRVRAAAWGDFVIGFYNPRSRNRHWQLGHVVGILLDYRSPDTPVAIIRNVTRPDEQITVTTLGEFDPIQVDMFTLVLVGNSQSYAIGGGMATPRGYTSGNDDVANSTEATPVRETSKLYPISLVGLENSLAVVVGGGPVGTRKVRGLLKVGAKVKVVSPEITPALQMLVDDSKVQWVPRAYQGLDLAMAKVVFAATNQRLVNAEIAHDARLAGAFCNVADAPDEGDFYVPAVYRHDGMLVAVSSEAGSPRRSVKLRDEIGGLLGGE